LLRRKIFALVLVFATVVVIASDVFALVPPPPGISILITPESQLVAGDGCPAIYSVLLISREGFYGRVNLTLVDPPNGVTTTFIQNPVEVPAWEYNVSLLIVNVTSDTPQGDQTINVKGIPLPGGNNIDIDGYFGGKTHFTLYVGSCEQLNNVVKTTTVTTTIPIRQIFNTITTTITIENVRTQTVQSTQTSISTTTLTRTTPTSITQTNISTTTLTRTTTTSAEQITEPSIYGWAIGATIIVAILTIILLRKR
jgi:hypothetical protein